jgi:multidrug efflux pump subunit AcrB
VSLSPKSTKRASEYIRILRSQLKKEFPSLEFYFQPADIVTQILNFGLPSPIDVQVSGAKRDVTYAIAREVEKELAVISGAVDVRLFQVQNAPRLHIEVDRTRAGDVGLTQRDIANNVLLTVSSSSQVSPSYWIDPATGNNYPVSVRVPENRINSLQDLQNVTIQGSKGTQLLADVATLEVKQTPLFVTHINVQPTFNVRADVSLSDLGSVASQVDKVIEKYRAKLPPGSTITVRGQAASMWSAFARLGLGLAFAALLVYALMVINFQSWRDPFIIITALVGAGVGIVVALFVTQTTFSVPSLMGAIMSIGVATANSILVVSFANDLRKEGYDSVAAALEAGRVRLRPVIMTALAMIIGMFPMSLGLSVGSEQNAALGRAVIGGLLGATAATLFFVPVVYSLMARRAATLVVDSDLEDAPSAPAHGAKHDRTI